MHATSAFSILLLLCVPCGYYFVVSFATNNGLLDLMGKALDSAVLPGNVTLAPALTGWHPTIDWQLKASVVFHWVFSDGLRPDVALCGLEFVGNWGASWLLIEMESLRKGNKGKFISYDAIIGVLIFQFAHAVMTPLYLAVQLIVSPTNVTSNREVVSIDAADLQALPLSFIIGYIIPLFIETLPAPSVLSLVQKQSVMAWYQQWHLYIAVAHFSIATIIRRLRTPSHLGRDIEVSNLRTVYAFAFGLAAIPHISVLSLSCAATFYPTLFTPEVAIAVHPRNVLLPKSPFRGVKALSIPDGAMWLIQWDYVWGNVAQLLWALGMYVGAHKARRLPVHWVGLAWKAALFSLLAGPSGAAVELIWERDELIIWDTPTGTADAKLEVTAG